LCQFPPPIRFFQKVFFLGSRQISCFSPGFFTLCFCCACLCGLVCICVSVSSESLPFSFFLQVRSKRGFFSKFFVLFSDGDNFFLFFSSLRRSFFANSCCPKPQSELSKVPFSGFVYVFFFGTARLFLPSNLSSFFPPILFLKCTPPPRVHLRFLSAFFGSPSSFFKRVRSPYSWLLSLFFFRLLGLPFLCPGP